MNILIYLAVALIVIGIFIVSYTFFSNSSKQNLSFSNSETTPASFNNSAQIIPSDDGQEKKLDEIIELIKNKDQTSTSNHKKNSKLDLILKLLKRDKHKTEAFRPSFRVDQGLSVPEKYIIPSSPQRKPQQTSHSEENKKIENEPEKEKEKILKTEFSSTTMYEDKSGLIDYSIRVGSVDPTLEKYKMIKRIGRGKVVIHDDGLTFNKEGKMYRFDFHQIDKIYTGKNYLALTVMRSPSVKLFFNENVADLILSLNSSYDKYLNG